MFSNEGDGTLLSPYVLYIGKHMYEEWQEKDWMGLDATEVSADGYHIYKV